MTYPNGLKKPSEHLADVLAGRVSLEAADESVRMMLVRVVYERAAKVLAAGDRDARAKALDAVEPAIRSAVEAKARELFEMRKAKV